MFFDLHKQITNSIGENKTSKIAHLANNKQVAICAIGGFPIIEIENKFKWLNNDLNQTFIQDCLKDALGFSASITFMNKAGHSLSKLGDICKSNNHDWAFHWVTISFVFCGYNLATELSISRDKRFYMSWAVNDHTGKFFVASGSIKDWLKFSKNFEDKDFDISTREAMKNIYDILKIIME